MVATQTKIAITQPKLAARFRKKADTLASKVESKLAPRDMGTWRKFGQAMSAREDGLRMLCLQTVLTHLADGLEAGVLEFPLSTLSKPQQIEDLLSIASRLDLDSETIRRRDLQCKSQWTSEAVTADCDRPDSMIGELYSELKLAEPSEMLALVQRLQGIIEDSNCIDWDAEELLRLRGEVRLQKISGFVPTPPDLADELIDWLCLEDGDRLCDPAAGDGAILEQVRLRYPHLKQVQCCEVNADLSRILRLAGFELESRDYFEWNPTPEKRPTKIAANPPFEQLEEIDFLYKMWRDLAPGGRLATIMSNSYTFSSKRKAREFREWLTTVPVILEQENDRNAFKPSGCNIATRMLVLQKPV
ncbi:MAG: hypothetical protein ACFBSF_17920 [Leptolyngbyaceae cyanobacterium]